MKHPIRAAFLAVFLCLLGAGMAGALERTERFSLEPGSRLRVKMPVGQLRIVGSRQAGVHVYLSVNTGLGSTPELERQIEIRFRPGPRAELEIRAPEGVQAAFSKFHMEAEVTVPFETHLDAELGVGGLRVRGVEGDLRAHVGVGELRLELSDPALYKSVRAEAGIGGINHPFRHGDHHKAGGSPPPDKRGWLGRKYQSTFKGGRYRLDAAVGVGDVRISEARVI